ncbi:P27 family phage terminase small subunit [Aeromonas veronii]
MSTKNNINAEQRLLLQGLQKNKAFIRLVEAQHDVLKTKFNIDVDQYQVIMLVGLQILISKCMQDLINVTGTTISVLGDAGQTRIIANPNSNILIDLNKQYTATLRELGLTPKARLEFKKITTETQAVEGGIGDLLQQYLKGGLPK